MIYIYILLNVNEKVCVYLYPTCKSCNRIHKTREKKVLKNSLLWTAS